MAKGKKPRLEARIDRREANLVGMDSPDDPLSGAEPLGDPQSLVGLDSPDDADQHWPYEGGRPPRPTGKAARAQRRR
ncbi:MULTISPECIES: hypothetical protein [Limnochorda]|uniref:hypothetical protein n=1 Tax=Limnochorda TaxID=1676651 RepID=UPI0018341154|nr:hypothetical protein [Limnochorda pilosa]MBO2518558.1 hypothetical protein [Bacillota bacterium]NMA72455.1 hypothetical protein [Bacillota bacterium]